MAGAAILTAATGKPSASKTGADNTHRPGTFS
jgi:hypothetical protein